MADSNITKQALANALTELMNEIPFEKINVAQICEKCDMNRKSFYYHFKDKYDLVNWIFDEEFSTAFASENSDWKTMEVFCQLFYQNRTFYRNALKIKGQNSFSNHFCECVRPILEKRIGTIMNIPVSDTFTIHFFCNVCLCALEQWLSEKDCMPPEQFFALLKNMIQTFAISVCRELEK